MDGLWSVFYIFTFLGSYVVNILAKLRDFFPSSSFFWFSHITEYFLSVATHIPMGHHNIWKN